ncbi:MAG TPA: hypothetical protein VG325_06685 [Solirubrobacteraceae bacterium]|nr:hypothetical protein [Solirubrobacteraceae bacterium]
MTPAPGIARVQQREERERQAAARRRQADAGRREQKREPGARYRDVEEFDDPGDDEHPHVDVTV